jgi:hypothetical protein
MPKFNVWAAFSVQYYLDVEIEATDLDDAIDQIKKNEDIWSDAEPDYETVDEHRIVAILDETDEIVAEAIYINP